MKGIILAGGSERTCGMPSAMQRMGLPQSSGTM